MQGDPDFQGPLSNIFAGHGFKHFRIPAV